MGRPILFSTEMVRAILRNEKTQTRRVISKPKQVVLHDSAKTILNIQDVPDYLFEDWDLWLKAPYQPGDRLYVRETWNATSIDGIPWKDPSWENLEHKLCFNWNVRYKATPDHNGQKWLPSIHMPHQFARIWLRVKDVRVERLQEISWKDCGAEGAGEIQNHGKYFQNGSYLEGSFRKLWDSTTKDHKWDTNPWVWVVEFEVE